MEVQLTLRAAAGSNEVSLGWDAIIPTPFAYRVYRADGSPFIIITETVETAYPDTSVTKRRRPGGRRPAVALVEVYSSL